MPGPLVVNGGDELQPGNEAQDRILVAAAGGLPIYLVPTAAVRQDLAALLAQGISWFAGLGGEARELPVRRPPDARSGDLSVLAAGAGAIYLLGGDPGYAVKVLAGSPVWTAIVAAWKRGAGLAGSSAGAMAMGQSTLVMARWPRHLERKPIPALGLLPGLAVIPHHDQFGHRWRVLAGASELEILRLDSRTAAVHHAGRWRALGAGKVGFRDRRFTAGDEIVGLPPPEPEQPAHQAADN
ncbi:MAG: Type 1 glutamine amidotransferase-like domain-containing protein [Candidatus Dormibacteraeota bacterium]|nr:Type 1 glutamine amidotransferase-like domain-containing protein [Candidatus Dormibacteraeota bacterium]